MGVLAKQLAHGVNQCRVAILSMITCALTASVASACMVCVDLPDETLTDQLWAADVIVFARPSSQNPFNYEVTSTLRGTLEAPIPFLVNTAARRQFAKRSDTAALVLRMPDGTWDLRGLGGPDFSQFVHDALDNEVAWTDEANDPDRAEAFRALHAHTSPNLRRLALTELSHFPYRELKAMQVGLTTDWMARRLFDASWFGWQPVLVHLLGLHSEPLAHDLVRRHAMQIRVEDRVPWLVALVEIDGATGVDKVVAQARSEGPTDEVARAAIRALAIHVDATPDLVEAILPALRLLMSDDPDLAAEAAGAFLRVEDFSMAPDISRILDKDRVDSPASYFVLTNYVAQARAAQMDVILGTSVLSGDPYASGASGASQ